MKYLLSLCLLSVMLVLGGCTKEMSHEGSFNIGSSTGTAVGSLKNDNNACLPASVVGTFNIGTELGTEAYLEISINVAAPGTYTINTNTVNGVFFTAKGIFYQVGIQKVRLYGKGTFVAAGDIPFTYSFNNSSCTIAVPVGTSGGNGNGTGNGNEEPGNGGNPSTGAGQWSATIGGKAYSGKKVSSFSANGMLTIGLITDDQKYAVSIILPGDKAVGGSYSTKNSMTSSFIFADVDAQIMYVASYMLQDVTIKISNVNGGQFDGTFSGTAINVESGKTVSVSNGQFKVQ